MIIPTLNLNKVIMTGKLEDIKELLNERTEDGFGFNLEQMDNILTSVEYLKDLINRLEYYDYV